ncbi:hypothetical protein [Enteractinococcus coprophilus]|uniref:Uncharacterized protein n=1 Tax=Enteractinococcus coprophilus TaxID=1027633 RepID=A0A543AMS3_9MICC|nr:hypothetical protein [Enteractinococcus coprophilus]TQL73891.1 hypothetical protein FB556_0340 [Enteractinococcus coprophilus]
MSGKVTGGPSHWRANLDELTLGATQLREATEQTMRLAGDAMVAGGLLSGVTIMTPQGPLIAANTIELSTSLLGMRAQVEVLAQGVNYAVAAYLETEAQITNLMTLTMTPTAVVLSLFGVTSDLNVPNEMYELAIRGTTSSVWALVEMAVNTGNQVVPGSKLALGHAIGWTFGLNKSIWDVPPTQRTYEMLAHTLQQFGLTQLAPYDINNVTSAPGLDGWQDRDTLDVYGSTKAMQLLKDYAYEPDTVTIAKLTQADGSEAYALLYAGTTPLGEDAGPLGLLHQENAFGATGVVESIAADSVHIEEATMQMLEQAGVPAGATIIPMGYSQGGTHAMNVGMSDKMKAKYSIPDVLTVAAPTGHRRTDDLSTNFVHIEHEHDKVPALTGASNEGRINRTTIEVEGYPEYEVEAGVFGPEHNFEVIDHQLAEALADPGVAKAAAIPLENLESKMGGAVAVQQFQLERQQATPTRHPLVPSGRAAAELKNIVSVRPLQEWMTTVQTK